MHELSILDLMLPGAAECLVLVGIHSYLGLHVIRRRVIFVDLALAQIAALGTTIGFLLGMAPDSLAAWIFSVLTAMLGAVLFTVTRLRHDRVPHEAFIGIIYAVAAAAIVLLVEMAPQQGADSIGKVLTGAILYVKWESIGFAAVMYSIVGVIHWVFRKQFILISEDPDEARRQGMNLYLWDFLFYMTFGLVISISVRTAGVLMVFVFLIAPAIFASLITKKLRNQLAIGWSMGLTVTVLGMFASYDMDLPSGPTVVVLYGIVLGVGMIVVYMLRAADRGQAVRRVGLGLAMVAATVLVVMGMGRMMAGTALAQSEHSHHAHAGGADEHAEHHHDADSEAPRDAQHLSEALVSADLDEQRALLAEYAEDTGLLSQTAELVTDDSVKLAIAGTVQARDPALSAKILLTVLTDSPLPFVKSEALDSFSALAGQPFDFDLEGSAEDNAQVLEQMQAWIDGVADGQ